MGESIAPGTVTTVDRLEPGMVYKLLDPGEGGRRRVRDVTHYNSDRTPCQDGENVDYVWMVSDYSSVNCKPSCLSDPASCRHFGEGGGQSRGFPPGRKVQVLGYNY